MLQKDYLPVLEAGTKDEFEKHVIRFARDLGFPLVSAMVVIEHVLGEPEFIAVHNAPAGYHEQDWNGDQAAKVDPVMQHCKRRSVPIVWNQATYVEAGQAEKWELQAAFGYRCGIAVVFHLPERRHFLLGVDRDQPLPQDPEEVGRMLAAVQLFAVHAQEASTRFLRPAHGSQEVPTLTPRELETLRWTLEGKTAWEVGRILGIAENTVIRHAHCAVQKLGCSNKHHAAVRALRLGLIK